MKDYIDNEDLATEGFELMGWKADNSCPSGSLSWWTSDEKCVIYGTPNWADEGIVPFVVTDTENGEQAFVGELNLQSFKGDIQTQRRIYANFLKFVIKNMDSYTSNLQPF